MSTKFRVKSYFDKKEKEFYYSDITIDILNELYNQFTNTLEQAYHIFFKFDLAEKYPNFKFHPLARKNAKTTWKTFDTIDIRKEYKKTYRIFNSIYKSERNKSYKREMKSAGREWISAAKKYYKYIRDLERADRKALYKYYIKEKGVSGLLKHKNQGFQEKYKKKYKEEAITLRSIDIHDHQIMTNHSSTWLPFGKINKKAEHSKRSKNNFTCSVTAGEKLKMTVIFDIENHLINLFEKRKNKKKSEIIDIALFADDHPIVLKGKAHWKRKSRQIVVECISEEPLGKMPEIINTRFSWAVSFNKNYFLKGNTKSYLKILTLFSKPNYMHRFVPDKKKTQENINKWNRHNRGWFTEKRIETAIRRVQETGSTNPEVILTKLMSKFEKYTLEADKMIAHKGHPAFLGRGNAWLLDDHIDFSAECQAICRYVFNIANAVGLQCNIDYIGIYALPNNPAKPITHYFNSYKNQPTLLSMYKPMTSYFKSSETTDQYFLADKTIKNGTYSFKELFQKVGRNNFEACLKLTVKDNSGRKKEIYYAGGAGIFKTAKEVLHCFESLVKMTIYKSEQHKPFYKQKVKIEVLHEYK